MKKYIILSLFLGFSNVFCMNEDLLFALAKNDTQQAQEIINSMTTTDYGTSALPVAAHHGNLDIVRLLIDKNVNVNNVNVGKNSALCAALESLQYAALMNVKEEIYYKIIDLLVNSGADTNIISKCGNALSYALRLKNSVALVTKLLKAGGRPSGYDYTMAVESGNKTMMNLLLDYKNPIRRVSKAPIKDIAESTGLPTDMIDVIARFANQ
jgi:ankyrin repeat protein